MFRHVITTLLGRSNDGPRMVDAEFGLPIYQLNDWADEHNVLVLMTCHLRKQARDATSNTVRIGDLFGAGSQAWAASDVWAIWKADTADDSYNTHLILKCLKGRFCEEGTAWNLDGCKEDYSHRVVSVVDPSDLLPLKSNEIKNQALALIQGSGPLRRSAKPLAVIKNMRAAYSNYCCLKTRFRVESFRLQVAALCMPIPNRTFPTSPTVGINTLVAPDK